MQPRVTWSDRVNPLFVEIAETIGITTNLVMAATVQNGYVFAMATPDYDAGSRDIVKYVFKRDADGILREVKREVEVNALDELEAFVKRGLEP